MHPATVAPAIPPFPCAGPNHVVNVVADASLALAAGQVSFAISNTGTIAHEFVIVRTDLASDALPKDGGVEEEASDVTHVDEAEDIDPGTSKTLTETLAPGKYVVFCNLPGHHAGGMHGSCEVVSTSWL